MRRSVKAGSNGLRGPMRRLIEGFTEGVDSDESCCRMRLPDTAKRELAGSLKQVVKR